MIKIVTVNIKRIYRKKIGHLEKNILFLNDKQKHLLNSKSNAIKRQKNGLFSDYSNVKEEIVLLLSLNQFKNVEIYIRDIIENVIGKKKITNKFLNEFKEKLPDKINIKVEYKNSKPVSYEIAEDSLKKIKYIIYNILKKK